MLRRLFLVAIGLVFGVLLWVGLRSGRNMLSTLHPARVPVPKLAALPDGSKLEPVAFRATDGVQLSGWYVAPRNGAVVIVLHGWASNRAGMLPEAEMLTRAGFGVLMFDWRAHGDSEGNLSSWGEYERRDLSAALVWLAKKAPAAPLGALGFSMGGMTLVEVAARERQIRAVALEGMYPSMFDVAYQMEAAYGPLSGYPSVWSFKLFGPHLDTVRPVDRLCSLSPRPLLLIYGGLEHADQYNLTDRLYAASCEPKQLWIVPGAGHGQYSQVDGEGLRSRLITFFTRSLLATKK